MVLKTYWKKDRLEEKLLNQPKSLPAATIADFLRHIPRPIENLTVGWFDGIHSTICRRELSRSDRQVSAPLPADLETSGITFQPWKVSIRLPRVRVKWSRVFSRPTLDTETPCSHGNSHTIVESNFRSRGPRRRP